MKKQTRIGIIRQSIKNHGGNSHFPYYADNTKGAVYYSAADQLTGDALYKIPKWSDGLTKENRQKVVDELNKHPKVKKAYLSRLITQYGSISGHHLKVRFYGLAR